MTKQMIQLKIDVSKIDKTKLYNGKKGTYLDATLFLNDQVDQYGNHGFIVQSVSKEERESGVKGTVLGNVKIFQKAEQSENQNIGSDNDLPF
jgi:hypothetical protein